MKISLITVCFNSEKTIAETFESVLRQTWSDCEYIIVDGLSTDRTMDIVRAYALPFEAKGFNYRFKSEKDMGLYDAMNKGLKQVTGDVVGILNSDDVLASQDALRLIAETFEKTGCDAVYSDLLMMDPETMTKPNRVFIAGRKSYKLGWYPPHPTLYVKRDVLERTGQYNTVYRVAADYDYMLRLMKQNIRMVYIPQVLVHMRAGGVSTNSLKAYKRSFDEAITVLKSNEIKMPYTVNILRTFVIFKQRLLGILSSIKNKEIF